MSYYLNETNEILNTYGGRDKVIRTLCYTAKFIGGLPLEDKLVAERFTKFSKIMSATRATLRLFDDLPMLQTLLEYGWGRDEPDKYMSALGVITNVIDQLYYPIEKVGWLAEYDLISVKNPGAWDVASSVCWVASIYLSLMKSLRCISLMQNHRSCLQNSTKFSSELADLTLKEKLEVLASIRYCVDLVHAVNTLPPGFLWSGRLNTWQIGLIGTISSLLGVGQLLWKRSIAKQKRS